MSEAVESNFFTLRREVVVGLTRSIKKPLSYNEFVASMLFRQFGHSPYSRYPEASVSILYRDLLESGTDTELLSMDIWGVVNKHFRGRIPHILARYIDPLSLTNAFVHEKEHCDALSENSARAAVIDLFFMRDTDRSLILNGVTSWDVTSYEEAAMASCAPRSLDIGDIAHARDFAKRSSNPTLLSTIEKIIASKKTHPHLKISP